MKFYSELKRLAKYQGVLICANIRFRYTEVQITEKSLSFKKSNSMDCITYGMEDIANVIVGEQIKIVLKSGESIVCAQSESPNLRWKNCKEIDFEYLMSLFEHSTIIVANYNDSSFSVTAEFGCWKLSNLETDRNSDVRIGFYKDRKLIGEFPPDLYFDIPSYGTYKLLKETDDGALVGLTLEEHPFATLSLVFFKSQILESPPIINVKDYMEEC